MVVRMVRGEKEDYFSETEDGDRCLSDAVFDSINMANLSMNLCGGRFDCSEDAHLRFLPESTYGKSDWDGKHIKRKYFLSSDSYSINAPCFGLFFRFDCIHGITFPFFKGFQSQKARDEYAQRVATVTSDWDGMSDASLVGLFKDKRSTVELRARARVHHSPTNGNYWHVTLDTYRPDETDYVSSSGKQQSSDRNMFKSLKQHLRLCGVVDAIPKYKISRFHYLKWFAVFLPC